MKHAVAFMTFKRVVPWKVLSMAATKGSTPAPIAFGSMNREFINLRPGSQIWVVTRIAGELSLAACVSVKEIIDRKTLEDGRGPRRKLQKGVRALLKRWSFVALANQEKSSFYETNNAADALARHDIRFSQARNIVYRDRSLARSFKSCVEQARKTVFLSYRWDKGTPIAAGLARELRKAGWSPWQDRLALPEYEARREANPNAPRLKKLIKDGLDRSQLAVVINTNGYAREGWTKMELEYIRSKGMLWIQVLPDVAEIECDLPIIQGKDSRKVAREIIRVFSEAKKRTVR